jgi:hypothetical protein
VGEKRPFEYKAVSQRAIRRDYRFDALVEEDGSEDYASRRALQFRYNEC